MAVSILTFLLFLFLLPVFLFHFRKILFNPVEFSYLKFLKIDRETSDKEFHWIMSFSRAISRVKYTVEVNEILYQTVKFSPNQARASHTSSHHPFQLHGIIPSVPL
jgi:hypothetical protein